MICLNICGFLFGFKAASIVSAMFLHHALSKFQTREMLFLLSVTNQGIPSQKKCSSREKIKK